MKNPIDTGFESLNNILNSFLKKYTSKEKNPCIKTGFNKLDHVLEGGFHGGELILIAARTGMGKTAFACEIALHNAKSAKKICIFSFELSAKSIALRILAKEAEIDTFELTQRTELDEESLNKLRHSANELISSEILICDKSFSEESLIDNMRNMLNETENVDLVIVDYLHPKLTTNNPSYANEISLTAFELKKLAEKLDIPVLCCANLPRAIERRLSKRPRLRDLSLLGATQAYADTVLFLYRDHYYNDKAPENECEVIVAKNKKHIYRCDKTVKLNWNGRYMRFSE